MRNFLPWFLAGCFAVVLLVQSWRLETLYVAIENNPQAKAALVAAGVAFRAPTPYFALSGKNLPGKIASGTAAAGAPGKSVAATAGKATGGDAALVARTGSPSASPTASAETKKQLATGGAGWRKDGGGMDSNAIRPQTDNNKPSPATIQAWYTQAAEAFNLGDYDKAVSLLGQTIEANPKHGLAYDMMANVCRNLGLLPEQRSFYEQWAVSDPENPAPHARLAQFFDQQGMPGKAKEEARLYEQTPGFGKRADSYQLAANLYRSVGEYQEAERVLGNWVSNSPELASPHWSLAELYRSTGRGADAVKEYLNVLSLTPGNADAYVRVAEYYSSLKQYTDAIPMLQQAVDLRAGDLRQRIKLAELYQKNGSVSQALTTYQEIITRALPTSYEYKTALTGFRKLQAALPAK